MKIDFYLGFIGVLFILTVGFIIFSETNKKHIKRRNIRYKNMTFTRKPNREEWEALNKDVSEMTRKELRICERFYSGVNNPKMKEKIKEEREKRNLNDPFRGSNVVVVAGENYNKIKKRLNFATHKIHKKEFVKQRRKQERQINNK